MRHLYLLDTKHGGIKNQITNGEYVVRGIDRIDEVKRQIWFRASGKNADQDPYFIHYYRVNFDGTGLTRLTDGNGTHRVDYSPDREFFIDWPDGYRPHQVRLQGGDADIRQSRKRAAGLIDAVEDGNERLARFHDFPQSKCHARLSIRAQCCL